MNNHVKFLRDIPWPQGNFTIDEDFLKRLLNHADSLHDPGREEIVLAYTDEHDQLKLGVFLVGDDDEILDLRKEIQYAEEERFYEIVDRDKARRRHLSAAEEVQSYDRSIKLKEKHIKALKDELKQKELKRRKQQ